MYPDRYRSPYGCRYARSLLIDCIGEVNQGTMQEAGYRICPGDSRFLTPAFQAQDNRIGPLAQTSGDLSSIRARSWLADKREDSQAGWMTSS